VRGCADADVSFIVLCGNAAGINHRVHLIINSVRSCLFLLLLLSLLILDHNFGLRLRFTALEIAVLIHVDDKVHEPPHLLDKAVGRLGVSVTAL
jgi:hypothetical protein